MLIDKLIRAAGNPRQYLRACKRRLIVQGTKWLAGMCGGRGFYMQARMDVDPRSPWNSPDFVHRTGGMLPHAARGGGDGRCVLDLEPWDNTRRDMLALLLREVESRRVPGAYAEVGVWRGLTAKFFHNYAPARQLYLFDTFEGFGEKGVSEEKAQTGESLSHLHFSNTSEQLVRDYIGAASSNVHLIKGFFPESIPPELFDTSFAFVHLDADLYAPIKAGLDFFYPRLAAGGLIVVHDYNAWPGARQAVETFRDSHRHVFPIPMPDKSGSCVIQKTG